MGDMNVSCLLDGKVPPDKEAAEERATEAVLA
jgi:hypothetical protein